MIEFLRRIAAHRLAWGLLAASALFLELSALFFQYVLGLSNPRGEHRQQPL